MVLGPCGSPTAALAMLVFGKNLAVGQSVWTTNLFMTWNIWFAHCVLIWLQHPSPSHSGLGNFCSFSLPNRLSDSPESHLSNRSNLTVWSLCQSLSLDLTCQVDQILLYDFFFNLCQSFYFCWFLLKLLKLMLLLLFCPLSTVGFGEATAFTAALRDKGLSERVGQRWREISCWL